MSRNEFENRMSGHMHHFARFVLNDGTTKEGYAQPNDGTNVFLTALDGTSGGKVAIADIREMSFPNN